MIQQFYSELVRVLPLGDATFRSNLTTAGLLPVNLKSEIKLMQSDADKVEHFLDFGIKNDIASFKQLISVMEESADEIVQKLAGRIKDRMELHGNKPGTYMYEYKMISVLASCQEIALKIFKFGKSV